MRDCTAGRAPYRCQEMIYERPPLPVAVEGDPNTFNLRSTRAGSGYGQGQHDQGERPAGFLALGWIGGLGRIAVAPFGVAGVFSRWAVLAGAVPDKRPGPPIRPVTRAMGGTGTRAPTG